MNDRLEEFVRSHKDEFDAFEAPVNGWDKVADRIHPEKNIFKRHLKVISSSVAAAAVLAFIVIFNFSRSNNFDQELANSYPSELSETEAFYINRINQQKAAVFHLASNHPNLIKEMDSDLAELDSILADLKMDLGDNISNEEVVEAMIQNYRMKLMILEDIVGFLNQDSSNKQTENKQTTYDL